MASLEKNVSLSQITTGRRIFSLTEVEVRARARGLLEIGNFIGDAIVHDRGTIKYELEWKRTRGLSTGNPIAVAADNDVDRSASGLNGQFDVLLRSLRHDHPSRPLVLELKHFYFPDGTNPVIRLNWTDQLATMEEMVTNIETHHRQAFKDLGMTLLVDEFIEAVAAFRDALRQQPARDISFDVVRAAREQGMENVRAVIAQVVGKFYDSSSAVHVDARTHLLAPIYEQEDAMRALRRRRIRRPIDVDPDTGVELPDDGLEPDLEPLPEELADA